MSWLDRLKRALPPRVKARLLDLRKRWRRRQWEKRVENDASALLGKDDLVAALRRLGLGPGRDVLLHSAMSKLGKVEGGAETVLVAIREVIGPDATLILPTYPLRQSMADWMSDPTPFDVRATKSEMGKITEVFRARPGVLRSGHPTHAVAAEGPRAAEYTAEHHQSGSPCGPGSPFRRLSEREGLVLCLGTGIGKVTSHHTIEDLATDFPVKVYLDKPLTKRVIFADGHEELVVVRVHDPALAARRVDNHPACEARILARMRARGIVREGAVGQAPAHLFGAADLDRMHRDGLRDGQTIYEG